VGSSPLEAQCPDKGTAHQLIVRRYELHSQPLGQGQGAAALLRSDLLEMDRLG
jgi:hypothetical protein